MRKLLLLPFVLLSLAGYDERPPTAALDPGAVKREFVRSNVIDHIRDDIDEAAYHQIRACRSGGARLAEVTDPRRGGTHAFEHFLEENCGFRSELEGAHLAKVGETYWYGWSTSLSADYVEGGTDIIHQLGHPGTGQRFPCGGVGNKISIGSSVGYHMQHPDSNGGAACVRYSIGEVANWRGKWVDVVIHARWTQSTDGFFHLWVREGSGKFVKKIDYSGRTWWSDAPAPYFKMGYYTGQASNNRNADKRIWTDEHRMGSAAATCADVAPDPDSCVHVDGSGESRNAGVTENG